MTKKELSQYHWLQKEIKIDEERLSKLEQMAISTKSPQMDGMPKGKGGTSSKTENYAAEIVDLQAIIASKRIQCIHEKQRLERFIAEIDDSLTRLIFTLRCAEGLSWKKVAIKIGSNMTEHAARQIFSRYIKESFKREDTDEQGQDISTDEDNDTGGGEQLRGED